MPYQPGGTGIVLLYTMTPRVIDKGADSRGIGHWGWSRLQGKEQAVATMIVYHPCKPSSSAGQTVYEQHARALPILSDPRRHFFIALKRFIQDRQEQGDLIIIGMNLNDPVQQHDHTQFFGELYMKKIILTIHSGTSPLAANKQNESNYPIDGICCSLWLIVLPRGYSNFKDGIPSYHRVLWVKFQLTELFGLTDNIVKN